MFGHIVVLFGHAVVLFGHVVVLLRHIAVWSRHTCHSGQTPCAIQFGVNNICANLMSYIFVYIYTDPKNVVSLSSSIYPEHTSDFA